MVNVAGTAASSLSLMGKKKNAFFYINSSSPSSCSLYLTFLFFTGQKTIGNVAGYLVFFFFWIKRCKQETNPHVNQRTTSVLLSQNWGRGARAFSREKATTRGLVAPPSLMLKHIAIIVKKKKKQTRITCYTTKKNRSIPNQKDSSLFFFLVSTLYSFHMGVFSFLLP